MSETATLSVDEIDLSDPRFWARPLEERDEAFRLLREHRPLPFYDEPEIPEEAQITDLPPERGYYAVTRYRDIEHVSRNPKDFCSGQGSVSVRDMPADFAELFGSMIAMDDPRHARIRGIVSRRFTPRALERLLDSVDATADEILDRVVDRGEIDFVTDVAAPLPLLIICDMMGIPRSQYPEVLHNSNIILSAGDPDYFPEDQSPRDVIIGAGLGLLELMNELTEERRRDPKDDLTSALLHSEVAGDDEDRLTAQEISSFFILLVVAGNETTRTALSHGMYQLTRNPDQRRILVDDLEGVTPTAVEEIVRYASPVTYMRRTATRDVELAGRRFEEGDKFVLFYGSGNRDAEVFDEPDRFSVRRDPNPHIGFGAPGPHFCLGAHLARREMSVMLKKLFRRLPDIEASAEPERLSAALPLVNGIKRLPVRFTPGGTDA